MLEFIVLGQVPGTQIYISFYQMLILWVIAFMLIRSYLKYRRYQKLLNSAETAALYLAVIKKQRRATTRRRQA